MGGVTTKYLDDGANVVQEQDASNTATANLLSGLGVDQVFSRQVVGGATSSLLTDALGSTIALAGPSGAISTSSTYEPFGKVSSSGTADTNPYRFTGREDDGATGLHFYRARYYSPTFGRFISEDPLGFPGGPDPNLYAYVGNRPTMLTDPFGLEPAGCGFLGWRCIQDGFSDIRMTAARAVADIAARGERTLCHGRVAALADWFSVFSWDLGSAPGKVIVGGARFGINYFDRYMQLAGKGGSAGLRILNRSVLWATVIGSAVDLACRPFDE